MSNDTGFGLSGPSLADTVIECSADGILAFDLELRYTLWNRAMEAISGVSRGEVLGRNAFELFPFLVETGEDAYFRAALAGEASASLDRPFTVPGTGRSGFFEGHYSPIRDASGRVVGGSAVIRDITERKR